MSSLKLQKRLSASVLRCGKSKVWMDPNEINEIAMANSRKNIRKLIKDGFILKKPPTMHSRARTRKLREEKRKGRHSGPGTRKGTKNARTPPKKVWIRRIRVLRRLLKKYRAQKKIDRHLYHELYLKAKGNVFKSKRNLQEYIFKIKAEKQRSKTVEDQAQAHRLRQKDSRHNQEKSKVEALRAKADDSTATTTKKSATKTSSTSTTATKTTTGTTKQTGAAAKSTATKATTGQSTAKSTTTKATTGKSTATTQAGVSTGTKATQPKADTTTNLATKPVADSKKEAQKAVPKKTTAQSTPKTNQVKSGTK